LDEPTLDAWLDRHHVDLVRTFATSLDGQAVGKYLHRSKFAHGVGRGHAISDVALFTDLTGSAHLTFWHRERPGSLGDIFLLPDIDTLVSDGTDPNLGHCIGDFVDGDGKPLEMCPRSTLKRMLASLATHGYTMKATCEIEFFLFAESFADIRQKQYQQLKRVGASRQHNIYLLKNAYHAAAYMNEVTKRMTWKGIAFEGWNDEGGIGQLELNLPPGDPLMIADNVVRTKQILYEVAVDMGLAVTFMAKSGDAYGSGMHVHHSLYEAGRAVFFDPSTPDHRSTVLLHWLGGLMATLAGAVSLLCPTINAYRRLADFAGAPVAATWGEQNKTAAVRLITRNPAETRIEYRIGSSDMNPYLALATIVAGGLAGLQHKLTPPPEFNHLGWGLPDHYPRLPDTISKAAAALAADERLKEMLGTSFVDYWVLTRQREWLAFHAECSDPLSRSVTDWEYERYFELV
jgi:glutamine synthetase